MTAAPWPGLCSVGVPSPPVLLMIGAPAGPVVYLSARRPRIWVQVVLVLDTRVVVNAESCTLPTLGRTVLHASVGQLLQLLDSHPTLDFPVSHLSLRSLTRHPLPIYMKGMCKCHQTTQLLIHMRGKFCAEAGAVEL